LRKRMSRSIVMSALSHTGSLRVLRLDADLEALFAQSAKYWDSPRDDVPIDDDVEGLLIERLKVISTPIRERGMSPVIFICADEVRAVFYNYIKQRFSSHRWVKVLSVGELSRTTDLEQIGVLHID